MTADDDEYNNDEDNSIEGRYLNLCVAYAVEVGGLCG